MENAGKTKDYVFASSVVRSVEKNLLSRENTEAIADSRSMEDALKILYDHNYGENVDAAEALDVEVLLSEEIKKTYSFIRSIAPDEGELHVFLFPYDYHNLKVLVKAELTKTDASPFLMDVGTIGAAKLTDAYRDRDFVEMTSGMREGVLEVLDVYARTNNPQQIDFILDKYCYTEMYGAALHTGNDYIIGYVKLLIDTINLKTFVRLRQMKKSWDVFSQVFIPGGRIQDKLFTANYDEPFEQFADRLIPYGLDTPMGTGAIAIRENGSFTDLERLCDNSLMQYAKEAKYTFFGIEPLAAYLIAKEAEIKTVRIAMTGLKQGLSREMMAERLRETYV